MTRHLYCLLLFLTICRHQILALEPLAKPCSKVEIDKRIQQLLPTEGFTTNDIGKHGALFRYVCEPDYTRTDEDGKGHFECLSMFTGRCSPISLETKNPFLQIGAPNRKVACLTGSPGTVSSTSSLPCGDVPAIEHGAVSDGQSCFGSKRSIECDSDFRLVGSETVQCGIDSKWIVRGYCQENICGDEPMVENGFISSGSYYIGAERRLGCFDGFVLQGSSLVTCNSEAKWLIGGHCERDVLPIDCEDLHLRKPLLPSGVYSIYPAQMGPPVSVYCDMDYLGGGWTVFQRRVDGSQDFFMKWDGYKKGFGNLNANFWLGNDKIHAITSGRHDYNLLIALTANDSATGYALYDGFRIEDEANFYTLRFKSLKVDSNNIGDSLTWQKDMKFSTIDSDNDLESSNCARKYKGGWWYNACHYSNLNGVYGSAEFGVGLNWYHWRGYLESMKTTSMMIRRSSLLPPIDCEAIHSADASSPSGVYTISRPDGHPVDVYCDMTYLSGGWTVFQRRVDGSQGFFLKWADYKKGFGNPSANFWLGNDNIHSITSGPYEYNLLIAMTAQNGSTGYALYDGFRIEDEANFYKLRFKGFKVNGNNIGDSLTWQKDMKFSTVDSDNDLESSNCASKYKGGWWYNSCHYSNLNGLYGSAEFGVGLNWYHWRGYLESMKTTAMMIRRSSPLLAIDCEAIHSADTSLPSGVYTIYPPDLPSVEVYCDMTYLGGGWTVFQRRVDGTQDFLLKWADYKKGFGNRSANFWLGNDNIHAITSGKYEYNLLIALTANNGSTGYALYDCFRIEDEDNFYTLRFKSFKVNGGIGDSLTYQHKDMKFSTVDSDNDRDDSRNCASTFTGAWWYGACHGCNLNGLYGNTEYGKGLNWASWLWLYESMKTTAMMIRRSSL